MDAAELLAVEVHLDQAVDQLHKARVLAGHLDQSDDLDPEERLRLNEIAAEAGVVIQGIAQTLGGPDMVDAELLRLLSENQA